MKNRKNFLKMYLLLTLGLLVFLAIVGVLLTR